MENFIQTKSNRLKAYEEYQLLRPKWESSWRETRKIAAKPQDIFATDQQYLQLSKAGKIEDQGFWQALITVLGGWLVLQEALRQGLLASLFAALFGGLFWGFWGVTWIYEQDNPASPAAFALYSFLATALLAACLYLIPGIFSRPFAPSRWSVMGVSGFFLFLFVFVAVPSVPLALVILPVLFLVLGLTFWCNRQRESPDNPLAWLGAPIPLRNLGTLALMPLLASLFYSVYTLAGLSLPVNWVVYLVTTLAGFVLFFFSIWYIWRRRKPLPTSPSSGSPEATPSGR